ncbi:serine acetyltransferase [Arsenicicoccus sp. oral taxon 190]|nr:serine acetyltransferase [Arsenicicoccus sp. oral taxon 190]
MGLVQGVLEDLDAAIERDPAATGRLQMALVSPGLHAIWVHRVSHQLWQRESLRLPARLLSNLARAVTGVEIHPGATIGRRFFIDHGMGVVIGETAEIGDDCMLYNSVNLGGRSLAKGKRHPTLGNGVTVGSGARVLGAITLGDGSQVGANAVVVKDVPANAVAVGIPAQVKVPSPGQSPTDAMYDDPAVWI